MARRVSIAGVMLGCFSVGALGFGVYRGTAAQEPLPVPAPVNFESPLPLPAPSSSPLPLPETTLPALPKPDDVAPASGVAPPVVSPALLQKTGDKAPLPLPELPKATDTKMPEPMPLTLPKPAESTFKEPVMPVVTPKPAEVKLPEPAALSKPEKDLRPSAPTSTVNSGLEKKSAEREVLPAPRPATEASLTPVKPPSTTPGDAPMPFNPKSVVTSTIAGAALMGGAMAEDPKKPITPPTSVPADATTVEKLNKEIDTLKADLKFNKEKREQLELLVNGKPNAVDKIDMGLAKRLEKAEVELKQLTRKIELMEAAGTKSVVEKTTLPATIAGKGKIVIVNEFKVKLSVMLNGTSYPLDKDETKTIVVNEGQFKYELVDFAGATPVTSNIKEGETVTLRIK
jgi:hypothetical protein